jgi:hypothetical protein
MLTGRLPPMLYLFKGAETSRKMRMPYLDNVLNFRIALNRLMHLVKQISQKTHLTHLLP